MLVPQNRDLNEDNNFVEANPIAAQAVDTNVDLSETRDDLPNAVQNNNPTN